MFGSDAKVSLHSTGECQWSATGSWVRKDSTRRNIDRHFKKWTVPSPDRRTALHIFHVRIPETELRVIGEGEDVASVQWLPAPPKGHTVTLECYLTPITASDPVLSSPMPHPCLFSLPLADGRWFVVLHHVAPMNGKELEPVRAQLWQQAREAGVELSPQQRAVAFTENEGLLRGLIELCPPAV